MQVGIAERTCPGEQRCGDQCGHWRDGGKMTLCIADGLGHGPAAEEASKTALDYVASHLSEPLVQVFAGCDKAIGHTRGVAMGIAVIDGKAGTLTYAGIGNTRGMVVAEETAHFVSSFGIVGGGYRKLLPKTMPFAKSDLVILATDGLTEKMDVAGYREELLADSQRLAKAIVDDWGRETDDAAALVFRNEAE